MRKPHILLFLFVLVLGHLSNAQIITTYAGTGINGYSGDGTLATAAQFWQPKGLYLDATGNLYICDMQNFRIRKIGVSGISTTIAGIGTYGYSGDGGQASVAKLGQVYGITFDKTGNIYFTDGAVVRKINTAGIISTIAGTGVAGFSGDGGPASAAKIAQPAGIAIDSIGNIYFADHTNVRIRKINTSGIINTIAGNGTNVYGGDGGPASAATFVGPSGVHFDKSGNLYITDDGNYRVRKINSSGIITTVVGTGIGGSAGNGGFATAAQIGPVDESTTDDAGNLYLPDLSYGNVRRIDHSTGIITTIAGNGTACGYGGDGGPATAAMLCAPHGIAVDKFGTVYFSEVGNNVIRRIKYTVDVQDIHNITSSLTLSPNPSNGGLFTLNVSCDINETANIVITNITGQKIQELITTTNKPTEIQLNAPAGIYFVTISTAHGVWSEKVLVDR